MADRERLSGPDNAWRRMGTWNNLMAITGVMSFEGTLTYEELCERLEERLLRFDRFSQRIAGRNRTFRRPEWVRVEDFDVRSRVHHLSLPEPRDKATFEEFVGSLMSRPLDERQPLWEMYLLEEAGSGAGNAMVFRLNHSIGDGFALLYVLLGLIDDPEALEFPVGGISAPPPPDADGTTSTDGDGRSRSGRRIPGPVETARRAASGVDTAAEAAKVGYDLLTAEDEPRTPLTGDLGAAKRAAWTQTLDLETVKAIGEAHDATVNDVLLAATAGALRTHIADCGHDTDGLVVRCTVPVNLKPMERRTTSLGNHFGLAFVPLPVGIEDLGARIQFVRERTSARRLGIEAYLIYLTLSTVGRAPDVVQRLAMKLFERQATGIVTNVPGPLDSVSIAGTEVDDIMFWVPQANDQGLGISILSYDGGVRVGVAGDANLVPDPGSITGAFETEIDALEADLESS